LHVSLREPLGVYKAQGSLRNAARFNARHHSSRPGLCR
jgi:hypothetical protein